MKPPKSAVDYWAGRNIMPTSKHDSDPGEETSFPDPGEQTSFPDRGEQAGFSGAETGAARSKA
jgi:hypothetical protein